MVRPSGRQNGRKITLVLGLVALIGIISFLAFRPADFRRAGEAAIFHHVGRHFTVFRFNPDPSVLVIDCPSLHAQGLMFDRVAALIEKADAPKGRVLSAAALTGSLTAGDLTIGTYYYGDDYPAKALRKFFRLARIDRVRLTAEENRLHSIARQAGFLKAGATGAIISIPQAGPSRRVSFKDRAVILRHELSHGAYFTLPEYRAFVHQFFRTALTRTEQAAFKTFLTNQGYDGHDHGLIVNETIAYLIFTRDRTFFRADAVGLTPTRLATLRAEFIATMPDIWLKRLATAPLPSS